MLRFGFSEMSLIVLMMLASAIQSGSSTECYALKLSDQGRLGLVVSTGFTGAYQHWNYDIASEKASVPKSLCFGGGLAYGPVFSLSQMQALISAEMTISKQKSDRNLLYNYAPMQFTLRSSTIFMWLTFKGTGRFTPIMRAGLGAMYLEYDENFFGEYYDNVFGYWDFSFGFEGGLEYQISSHVGLSAYGSYIHAPVDEAKTRFARRRAYDIEVEGFTGGGIRMSLWL